MFTFHYLICDSPIKENEKFVAHNFSGKYLDCGTLKGYINSSKEISKL